MITTTLFGIALAPLYAAIAQVESDRGKTSSNVYQIDAHAGGVYVEDVNRIIRQNCLHYGLVYRPFSGQARNNKDASERMMLVYWTHWGKHYEKKTGKTVTMEVLARIHNGGPLGWKKPATVAYWNRVAAVLATQTEADVQSWAKGGAR